MRRHTKLYYYGAGQSSNYNHLIEKINRYESSYLNYVLVPKSEIWKLFSGYEKEVEILLYDLEHFVKARDFDLNKIIIKKIKTLYDIYKDDSIKNEDYLVFCKNFVEAINVDTEDNVGLFLHNMNLYFGSNYDYINVLKYDFVNVIKKKANTDIQLILYNIRRAKLLSTTYLEKLTQHTYSQQTDNTFLHVGVLP